MAADVLAFVRTLIGFPKNHTLLHIACVTCIHVRQMSWLRFELLPMQTIVQGNIEINEDWVWYPT
jgi:hypothetical protein